MCNFIKKNNRYCKNYNLNNSHYCNVHCNTSSYLSFILQLAISSMFINFCLLEFDLN